MGETPALLNAGIDVQLIRAGHRQPYYMDTIHNVGPECHPWGLGLRLYIKAHPVQILE